MLISIAIVAYNEELLLPSLLGDVIKQDYKKGNIEIILINSMSTDKTKVIMNDFKDEHYLEYYNILVLDNINKKQASGWNIAFINFTGEAIVRIDAHATIPTDFISQNSILLREGESVTGGVRSNVILGDKPKTLLLLEVEKSLFGSGIAVFRQNKDRIYVKSMFHAAYKRNVIKDVGGMNECLGRTEDNEFHYRIREHGYKLCYSSNVRSFQYTRNTLKKMITQKFKNGYWIALTAGVNIKILSIYHFVPFAFVLALILSAVVSIQYNPIPFYSLIISYFLFAFYNALKITKNNKKLKMNSIFLIPIIFLTLHISYGVGTLTGLFKLPWWKVKVFNENTVLEVRNKINQQ